MARSASAPDVGGASRLYGHVSGELMFAFDIAAFGNELRSLRFGPDVARRGIVTALPVVDLS